MVTKGLNRNERLIIILYYYEELTMKEIGATLDLSESPRLARCTRRSSSGSRPSSRPPPRVRHLSRLPTVPDRPAGRRPAPALIDPIRPGPDAALPFERGGGAGPAVVRKAAAAPRPQAGSHQYWSALMTSPPLVVDNARQT